MLLTGIGVKKNFSMDKIIRKESNKKTMPNVITTAFALGISVTADLLDFIAAPIFALPIIGDVFDVLISGLLYSVTKSKVSLIMNLAEFIPLVGDFLPAYTVSTLIWIVRKYGYENSVRKLMALFYQTIRYDLA